MTGNQLCVAISEQRSYVVEKLARNVFSSWRPFAKGRIVFVQKFVIKLIVDDFAGAAFNFADVDQHPGDRIDPAAEDKIGDVIATGSVFRAALLAKRGDVFAFTPERDEQPARGRKLKPFADRQEHDGANILLMSAQRRSASAGDAASVSLGKQTSSPTASALRRIMPPCGSPLQGNTTDAPAGA